MKYILKMSLVLVTISMFSCNKNDTAKDIQNIALADDYLERIDSLIQIKEPHFFNGVILISKDDDIVYKKEYGYSDFDTKKPISLENKFRIFSNSKQVTAVLILREVENGTIDLHKPIKNYLPNFNPSWADSVTIHHLLNMSSGVTDINKPLAFELGTDFYYSNPAYGLLSRILENVKGKKFAEVANSLFRELDMKNSYAYEFGQTDANLIDGHWIFEDDFRIATFEEYKFTEESWKEFLPGGGMVSNAYDLNLWDKKLHNGGILKEETYHLMITTDVIDNTEIDKDLKYGYGVNINENEPIKYIGHRGRGMGFVNIKIYVPDKKLDIIVLENVYHDHEDPKVVYHFETKIRDIVLSSNLVK
ncbi:MAG: serine hydrolase domain-containing protein [Bacteroidota bacterium]